MASYLITKINEYDAHGGPSSEKPGGDGHAKTATREGRYVINSIGKHVSYGKYAYWSGVAWGTEMRLDGEVTMVKNGGAWVRLTAVNAQWGKYKNQQKQVTEYIRQQYTAIANRNTFPNRWIFNDFGHTSVKYFKDTNHNWRLDGKEQVLGDFIHTTPPDEYLTSINRGAQIKLAESHGCIHVKPLDIDTMIGNGYLKKGNTIEVHNYSERMIPVSLTRSIARPPFEVHFYPGVFKIAIYRVSVKN